MILAEYLKELEPGANISLCYRDNWRLDGKDNNKIYNAFYIGTVQEAPSEALNKTVVKNFISFMWNTTTYILDKEEQ